MQEKKDQLVLEHMQDEQAHPLNQIGYGIIMRYTVPAFRNDPWSVHRNIMQANTLVLVLMEQHNPIYIHRSFQGCSAVYTTQEQAVEAGIAIQKVLHTKHIPAGLAIYKDHGYWEKDLWISSQEYVAGQIALFSQHQDLFVLHSLLSEIQLPVGMGMLPAPKTVQHQTGDRCCTLHDYRDYDEDDHQNTQSDN